MQSTQNKSQELKVGQRRRRLLRVSLVGLHDLLWVPLSLLLAFFVRFGGDTTVTTPWAGSLGIYILIALSSYGLMLWWRGCYHGLWRFASLPDLVRLLQAVLLGTFLAIGVGSVSGVLDHVPRSLLLIYPVILLLGLGLGRVLYRIWRDRSFVLGLRNGKRVIVIGAGRAGELLIRDLAAGRNYLPVAILDDDPAKLGRTIHGVRVRGAISQLVAIARKYGVDHVLFAIPSASPSLLRSVVKLSSENGLSCETLPLKTADAEYGDLINELREVTIEDLLGREAIELKTEKAPEFIRGRCVLVTGGGGSIGSELCRQIMRLGPKKLIILDHSEYALYKITQELSGYPEEVIKPCLGSVCNKLLVNRIFKKLHPEIIFHAAAYKHVPIVEANPFSGVEDNVFGTLSIAECAIRHHAKRFVLISTDKAVSPTNIMGATKRLAEKICSSISEGEGCQFVVTRFGNVLGSSGSVVPLFREQISRGGPVTVTHPDVTRYFMTIPEAVSLILEAAASEVRSGIFVLDMGKPIAIDSLAREMISLSGLNVGSDIEIEYVGLRPGEKLFEELFYENENPVGTSHPKLLLAKSSENHDKSRLYGDLEKLRASIKNSNEGDFMTIFKKLVPEYTPYDLVGDGRAWKIDDQPDNLMAFPGSVKSSH